MGQRDLVRFKFKMSFRWMSYIEQPVYWDAHVPFCPAMLWWCCGVFISYITIQILQYMPSKFAGGHQRSQCPIGQHECLYISRCCCVGNKTDSKFNQYDVYISYLQHQSKHIRSTTTNLIQLVEMQGSKQTKRAFLLSQQAILHICL